MSGHELDARRLLCPLPVIRVQNCIAKMEEGEVLRVYFTDPGALIDIPAWCRVHGHRVLESGETDGEPYLLIKVQKHETL